VFRKMLASGYPPDDWLALLNEAQAGQGRLDQLGEKKIPLF